MSSSPVPLVLLALVTVCACHPSAALCSLGRAGHREGVLLTWVSFFGCKCWGQAVLVAEKMSSTKAESSISPGSAGGSWGTATPGGLLGCAQPLLSPPESSHEGFTLSSGCWDMMQGPWGV